MFDVKILYRIGDLYAQKKGFTLVELLAKGDGMIGMILDPVVQVVATNVELYIVKNTRNSILFFFFLVQ